MIGIVTVNWFGFEVTKKITDLFLRNQFQDFFLLIVNNSYEEKELFDKSSLFQSSQIKVIHNSTNSGYAGGLNKGISDLLAKSSIDKLLLINNDVEFDESFLEEVNRMASNENTIYAPVILNRDSRQVQSTGGRICPLLGGTININKNANIDKIIQKKPDFLSGCVLFFNRNIIEKVGFFDEHFGSYYEDVDFCLRAVKMGYKLEILWKLQVHHYHSYSTRKNSDLKTYLLSRNQINFAKKHLSFPHKQIFIIASVIRGFLQGIFRNQLTPYFKGVRNGFDGK